MAAGNYYVICGGTFVDIAPHLSLCAPAFGTVGIEFRNLIAVELERAFPREVNDVIRVPTRMALGGEGLPTSGVPHIEEHYHAWRRGFLAEAGLKDLRTNDDLGTLLDYLTEQPLTRGIIIASAVCDFEPIAFTTAFTTKLGGDDLLRTEFGRNTPRLDSAHAGTLGLVPAEKLLRRVRQQRKDIYLVAFKTTAGADSETQYTAGLTLLKQASANLVIANDINTHHHIVITPEQARYYEGDPRRNVLHGAAQIIAARSHLRFTRSRVVHGPTVPWDAEEIPRSLRLVVEHCIARGAYKPFLGSTVGHFAARGDNGTILTSVRKSDFNALDRVGDTTGLVRLVPQQDGTVVAHGAKPSVGGQSQRIIFAEHPDVDCIVHFHCPMRENVQTIGHASQRLIECGSHECGANTSKNLSIHGPIKAVMLDQHGPNVCFARDVDPQAVIDFIETHFDLEGRTDAVH